MTEGVAYFPVAKGARPVTLAFNRPLPEGEGTAGLMGLFAIRANELANKLVVHAPGGLLDALLVELLRRKASALIVPMRDADLKLIEKYQEQGAAHRTTLLQESVRHLEFLCRRVGETRRGAPDAFADWHGETTVKLIYAILDVLGPDAPPIDAFRVTE